MTEIPRIISVDDHVMEPPDLFARHLPSMFRDDAPRVERGNIDRIEHMGGQEFKLHFADRRSLRRGIRTWPWPASVPTTTSWSRSGAGSPAGG